MCVLIGHRHTGTVSLHVLSTMIVLLIISFIGCDLKRQIKLCVRPTIRGIPYSMECGHNGYN